MSKYADDYRKHNDKIRTNLTRDREIKDLQKSVENLSDTVDVLMEVLNKLITHLEKEEDNRGR